MGLLLANERIVLNKSYMSLETNPANSQPSQLWTDYYACKKPRCFGCIEQGTADNEYKFCSQEKAPVAISDERGREITHVFKNVYQCQVYHWTIYQGTNEVISKQS